MKKSLYNFSGGLSFICKICENRKIVIEFMFRYIRLIIDVIRIYKLSSNKDKQVRFLAIKMIENIYMSLSSPIINI